MGAGSQQRSASFNDWSLSVVVRRNVILRSFVFSMQVFDHNDGIVDKEKMESDQTKTLPNSGTYMVPMRYQSGTNLVRILSPSGTHLLLDWCQSATNA